MPKGMVAKSYVFVQTKSSLTQGFWRRRRVSLDRSRISCFQDLFESRSYYLSIILGMVFP